MNKILAVARSEYLIAATSKAFILGVVMMPIFMGGAFAVQHFTRDQVDVTPRRIAVLDHTGRLFGPISQKARQHNEFEIYSQGKDSKQTQAEFHVEQATENEDGERLDVALTQRVKQGELFAFAIIDRDVFDATKSAEIRYHSQTPSYRSLPNWLERVINDEVKRTRIQEMGLSANDVAVLSHKTPLKMFGLVTVDATGQATDAKEESRVLTFVVPFAGLMLMFMMVMSVAPSMLNNVLEEKMQKISEFLISSVTPFQLMMGKLLGAVGIGLTLSTIYLGAAYWLAVHFEIADRIPFTLYIWFVFFLLNALVIYGAIFSAIGAACSEIRDAQSLMTPVMLFVIIPMMCMGPIFDSPSSTFSRCMSLFPPATPMLMFARIAIPPGPAIWEIVLAAILAVFFAIGCVWAAGKVFRIGILSQGQAPTLFNLLQWIFSRS